MGILHKWLANPTPLPEKEVPERQPSEAEVRYDRAKQEAQETIKRSESVVRRMNRHTSASWETLFVESKGLQ